MAFFAQCQPLQVLRTYHCFMVKFRSKTLSLVRFPAVSSPVHHLWVQVRMRACAYVHKYTHSLSLCLSPPSLLLPNNSTGWTERLIIFRICCLSLLWPSTGCFDDCFKNIPIVIYWMLLCTRETVKLYSALCLYGNLMSSWEDQVTWIP